MAIFILLTLRVFARNLLRGNRRRNTFFVFRFNIWPGTRTLAFSSNKPTHYLLDHGDFNIQFNILRLAFLKVFHKSNF